MAQKPTIYRADYYYKHPINGSSTKTQITESVSQHVNGATTKNAVFPSCDSMSANQLAALLFELQERPQFDNSFWGLAPGGSGTMKSKRGHSFVKCAPVQRPRLHFLYQVSDA
jgi:hypothetical protein